MDGDPSTETDPDRATDTQGYPSGTEEYRSEEEDEVGEYWSFRNSLTKDWKLYGASSEEAHWRSLGGVPPPFRNELPSAGLPEPGRTPSPHVRQVNVKLSPEMFGELERLADEYGVTRSTMARMLITRGVQLSR
jgi:hypothetical protein